MKSKRKDKIVHTKLNLSRNQIAALEEIWAAIADAPDGEPPLTFGHVRRHSRTKADLTLICWPNLAGKLLVDFLDLLIKNFDLQGERWKK